MKTLPHPSITGLASGALLLKALNEGNNPGTTVLGAALDGNLETAARRFLNYAPDLVTTSGGKKTLVTAISIAVAGGLVRKYAPGVKLGGQRIFARI